MLNLAKEAVEADIAWIWFIKYSCIWQMKVLKLSLCHMQFHHQNIFQKLKFIQYLDEHVENFSIKPKFQSCVSLAFINNEEMKEISNQEMWLLKKWNCIIMIC